jgi:flagellar motor switch protein FliN/FliY
VLVPFDGGVAVSGVERVGRVKVSLQAVIGSREVTLEDLSSMAEGSIIELDRQIDEAVDLLANGEVVARGDVVVIDAAFGLRITEVIRPEGRG